MSPSQTRPARATAENVIDWLTELAERKGRMGMFTHWAPGYLSSMCSIRGDTSPNVRARPPQYMDLSTALGASIADEKRERWLDDVIWHHRRLFDRASQVLHTRLLDQGFTGHELDGLELGGRLGLYAECRLPIDFEGMHTPKASFNIVTVADKEGKHKTNQKVSFQFKDSFATFQGVLRDLTARSAIMLGREEGYTLDDGPWMYRLVRGNNSFAESSPYTEISEERGFRDMLRKLRNKETPKAAIWHSLQWGLIQPRPKSAEMESSENRDTEPLGEDGQPYFQAVDWARLRANGINGKHPLANVSAAWHHSNGLPTPKG
ncbi:MAG: hypothetical protein M1833_007235 [Piccolia ochrophora]|nr:MAG: hypothetical protein M1833_007235 [Piccolia ochrophora]